MRTKLLIEIRGGNIVNMIANQEISIVIVDYDNMENMDPKDKLDLSPYQPDLITNEPFYKAFEDYDGIGEKQVYKTLKKADF